MTMKNLKELSSDDYQSFLDTMFDGVEYSGLVFETDSINIDCCGVEYKMNESKRILSFSNPELIIWLYNKDVDLSIPLKQLKYDYVELDETNSILFEYAMDINRVLINKLPTKWKDAIVEGGINVRPDSSYDDKEKIKAIKKIQKDLINKI